MTDRASPDVPLVVGVVGPHDLVSRVVLSDPATISHDHAVRLLPIAYRQEDEAVERVERAQAKIDSLLFTGPLPYDLVKESGRLTVPATFISLSGGAFYAALLRCVLSHAGDPARISVDTVSEDDVIDAYADIDLEFDGVHIHSYRGPESATSLARYHVKLFESGTTTAALTGVHSVHRKLVEAGVPALRILPSAGATRTALRAAILMGRGMRLEESQIAIGIVEVPALLRNPGAMPHQWQHELRLGVHRVLIHEGRRMGATVLPLDSASFIVVATLGSVSAATDDLRAPPFVTRLNDELGVSANVGVGLGRTAEEAESNARVAVARAPSAVDHDFVVGLSAATPPRVGNVDEPDPAEPDAQPNHTRQLYERLMTSLRGSVEGDQPHVILDARRVEELLGLHERTARRTLQSLASVGLAWPLPLDSHAGPGRPRQRYRIVIDQPDSRSPSPNVRRQPDA